MSEPAYVRLMEPPPEQSDAEVVRQVLAGDRDAYRVLVRRYGDLLYRHALRMGGSPDVASELVQRALVRGYQRLDGCRDPERVGAWLFRILSNLALDHVRSPRRRDLALDALPDLPAGAPTPEAETARTEFRERLEGALARLTPEQREAFVLKHVEGLRYEEIGAMMGVSVPALKMRVQRAREALRELLEVYA
ncbi:MAG: RNA polymerase sigma factor [Longimicrobiales bacterium]|nr:RNA polymerase sigma factor [Longimicrobiales bacterium]